MKTGTSFRAIARRPAIYLCLAQFFAFCWLTHHWALLKMEGCHRQFAVMNDRTTYDMVLIDCVTANAWLADAYVVLVVAAVAFAQFRGHPPWTYWLTAMILCIPCLLYWAKCVYICNKLLAGQS